MWKKHEIQSRPANHRTWPYDQITSPTPDRLDTARRQQTCKVVHLLGLHDAMATDPDPGSDGSAAGNRLTPIRKARFVDLPPGLHDPSPIHDVGHHESGGVKQPSAFEVFSVYSVGEHNLSTDSESTCGHQRGRVRRRQSAGQVHNGDGFVAPLGSYVGVSWRTCCRSREH